MCRFAERNDPEPKKKTSAYFIFAPVVFEKRRRDRRRRFRPNRFRKFRRAEAKLRIERNESVDRKRVFILDPDGGSLTDRRAPSAGPLDRREGECVEDQGRSDREQVRIDLQRRRGDERLR